MHKAFITTNKGAEEVAALEMSELVKCKNVEKQNTVVRFEVKELIDLCTVCYRAQSINKGVLLLAEFDVEKTLAKTAKNIKFEIDWNFKTFKVEGERHGQHDFNSVDISNEITKKILKQFKDAMTDYDNPELVFFTYVWKNKGYFGIDFSGIELAIIV